MGENRSELVNSCNFASVKPVMMELPYPELRVRERNTFFANLLSIDYCGSVSELSAITQYINNENRMSVNRCPMAQTILGIAMAEMIHLQKLGVLIVLLGGDIDFYARHRDGRQRMWTPQYLTISDNVDEMLRSGIKAEQDAIEQYRMHIKMIDDECVTAVLARIILDEEYHILMLRALLQE